MRKSKSKGGYQGLELATAENLNILRIDEVEYSIIPGVEIRHIAEMCSNCTTKEREKIRSRGPLRELGWFAASDPKLQAPYRFDTNFIEDAVLIVVWRWNEVFNNRGEVREAPPNDCKRHIVSLVSCMQQWTHCIVTGPRDSKCWGPSPRFDDATQSYVDYLGEKSVPRINPTTLHAKLGKRDYMYCNTEAQIVATSQMILDAVKWSCMASVIRSEVEKVINTLRLSGIPPARNAPEATPAPSDDDDRKYARMVRFTLPPTEAVEKAIATSAFNEGKITLWPSRR